MAAHVSVVATFLAVGFARRVREQRTQLFRTGIMAAIGSHFLSIVINGGRSAGHL